MAYADHDLRTEIFQQSYRCYPSSFIDKPHLEKGDKVIMPASALDRLVVLQIDYPMMFELNNPSADRVSHCGVLEFVADEGMIYLPYWMMQNMLLEEGDVVQVKSASLSKGTYVKLQPHTTDFLDISNPKAILETTLRNYSCLTTGDTIVVTYNNKKFYIDIVETKPSNAVSIIETDCEVDFAPPLDYKEPEKPMPSSLSNKRPPEDEEEPIQKVAKVSPFIGVSRRLDGKSLTRKLQTVEEPTLKKHKPESANVATYSSPSKSANVVTNSSPSKPASRQNSGKLVFGSNETEKPNESSKAAAKEIKQETAKKVEPKFQAFTGKKYSLKG